MAFLSYDQRACSINIDQITRIVWNTKDVSDFPCTMVALSDGTNIFLYDNDAARLNYRIYGFNNVPHDVVPVQRSDGETPGDLTDNRADCPSPSDR